MKCPYCNAEVEEEDVYCGECGGLIEKKRKKTGLSVKVLFVSVFLLIGMGISGIFFLDQKEIQKEIQKTEKQDVEKDTKSEYKEETDIETSKKNEENEKETVSKEDEKLEDQTDKLQTNEKQNEYVLEDSNRRYLTDSDVQGLTIQEINYAKNEIYARHGRKFQSTELQNYFDSKDWYNGIYEPEDFDQNYSGNVLNDYEKKNAEFLREKEFAMNPKGYQLDQ